jgi:hypothetical protein
MQNLSPAAVLLLCAAIEAAAQGPANCSDPISRDVDARCACVKDPSSQLCQMVKAGFYDKHDFTKPKALAWGTVNQPVVINSRQPAPARSGVTRAARPQQARVVALTSTDLVRFIDPNAHLAAGLDLTNVLQSPELVSSIFSSDDGEDARLKAFSALKEVDRLWLYFTPPSDAVLLMTGRFEGGVMANLFYAQGVRPVFLGDAHAMMIGAEPSIQASLARLARPSANNGWVARKARELGKDHETWLAVETPAGNLAAGALAPVRQFALGFHITKDAGLDGEAIADSETGAEQIAAWVEKIKASMRGTAAAGPLDALALERSGATLRFSAKGEALLSGDAGNKALHSDFGVALYSVMMAGFPGVAERTVASERLQSIKAGMKREEVLNLLGRPLTVAAIQGLDVPRETWTYQVPFGKQLSVRIEGGVVTGPAR